MAAGPTKINRDTAKRRKLEKGLSKARRELKRSRAELESAKARIGELEERLRRIQQSPAYRLSARLWRLRARLGGPLRGRADEDDGTARREPISGPAVVSADPSADTAERRREQRGGTVSRAIVLLDGATQQQLGAALADLRRRGIGPSELLVITDSEELRALDELGCRYEYVPPRGDWENLLGRDPAEYDDFVRRRLEMIGAQHGVTVPSPDAVAATS